MVMTVPFAMRRAWRRRRRMILRKPSAIPARNKPTLSGVMSMCTLVSPPDCAAGSRRTSDHNPSANDAAATIASTAL